MEKKGIIQEDSSSKRIGWIDFAKGILIVLVIIGHSTNIAAIRGVIYSFHMPAFFILSGMTMKRCSEKNEIKKSIRRLIKSLMIPAILLLITTFCYDFIVSVNQKAFSIRNFLLMLLEETVWPGGTHFKLGKFYISANGGMYWFLIVLFGDKLFFLLMNFYGDQILGSKISKRSKTLIKTVIIMSVTCAGVWLGAHDFLLPFSIDLVFATILFLAIGYLTKYTDQNKNCFVNLLITIVLWLIAFCIIGIFRDAYLDIKARRYPLFPLCYLCAINGSFALFYFSKMIKPSLHLYRFFRFIGRHTLALFCIHMWDYWFCDFFAHFCSSALWSIVFRIGVDLGVLFIFLLFKNIFIIRKEC